jgi:protein involved in polysaccharide export with SLBB domain
MKAFVVVALGFSAGVVGCGHAPPATADTTPAASTLGELALGPGDTFDIRVFGEQELSNTYRVDREGTIDYPLLGQLKVEGMDPHDLATLIQKRLAEKFLKNPQVSILMREQPSKKVTVIGQVARPGTYPFQANMTIIDAIALASGFTPIAAKNRVTIKRLENGEEKVLGVAVADIGESKAPNVPVRPGDVISVPERIF